MSWTKWLVCVLAVAAPLACETPPGEGELPAGQIAHTAPLTPAVGSEELPGTDVTAHVEFPIRPGRNVLWCASFQLAWNAAMDDLGGPLDLVPESELITRLNRRDVTSRHVNPNHLVTAGGRVADGTLIWLRDRIARKFPDIGELPLLAALEEAPPDDYVVYALLKADLPFAEAFEELSGMRFGSNEPPGPEGEADDGRRVATFGISQAGGGPAEEQVHVIWHEFESIDDGDPDSGPQWFVIELKTISDQDRLILAMLPPAGTLRQAIENVIVRLDSPNPMGPPPEEPVAAMIEQLRGGESTELGDRLQRRRITEAISNSGRLRAMETLRIPIVDVHVTHQFEQLLGRHAANPEIDMPLALAAQRTRFRLDRTGVELESESGMDFFAGLADRHFVFNKPFLIMLLRKGADVPYFALWIGNDELMAPAEPVERGDLDDFFAQ